MEILDILEPEDSSGASIENLRPFIEIPEHGMVFANRNELVVPITCRGFRMIKGQQVRKIFEYLWERTEYEDKINPERVNESIEYPFGQKRKNNIQQFDITYDVSKEDEDQIYWYVLFLDDQGEKDQFFSSYVGCISNRLVVLLDTCKIQMRDGILKKIKRLPKNKSFDYQIEIKFDIRRNIQEIISQTKHIDLLAGLLDD